MAGFTFDLTGDAELIGKLKALEPRVARNAVRTGLRRGAKRILAAARPMTPVRTGALVRALKVRVGKAPRGKVRMQVTTWGGLFRGKTFYGGFIELGWIPVSRRQRRKLNALSSAQGRSFSDKMLARVPGHPFLRDATAEAASGAVQDLRDAIEEAIRGMQK